MATATAAATEIVIPALPLSLTDGIQQLLPSSSSHPDSSPGGAFTAPPLLPSPSARERFQKNAGLVESVLMVGRQSTSHRHRRPQLHSRSNSSWTLRRAFSMTRGRRVNTTHDDDDEVRLNLPIAGFERLLRLTLVFFQFFQLLYRPNPDLRIEVYRHP